ncbi:hypothetical protein AVDCRST_MAG81-3868 [uncultured Synechococcales cyanobacterium]|uniref:Uncharacterized protein n=1 Tax=uncultured Synechococcales cyanobacterium TaxID=1936017 RepID=A0A6J4VR16_9CYAN|nr:hypothetical protein AVDCRST_MAG81-3868 [uncultured Synechococcales cyanobacterium]
MAHINAIHTTVKSGTMFKKTWMIGLLAATAFGFVSGPAQAGEANGSAKSIQSSEQSAANVGSYNDIFQDSTQVGVQDVDATSYGKGAANADGFLLQQSKQAGANVGVGNHVDQENTQLEVQQVDAEQFGSYYYP